MNIQYTDLNGEYFLFGRAASSRSSFIIHPLGEQNILRAEVFDSQVNETFEVSVHSPAYKTFLNMFKYETLLIEDCVAFIRKNVTKQMLVSSTEGFRNTILDTRIDLTPLVKYYPDLEKYVKPWYCEYDKHK